VAIVSRRDLDGFVFISVFRVKSGLFFRPIICF